MTTDRRASPLRERIREVSRYDSAVLSPWALLRRYNEGSDFMNFGYWTSPTQSYPDAAAGLVRKLVSFIPEPHGRILDVACGLGASTKLLADYYDAKGIMGINLSQVQLGRARTNAPQSSFAMMDAAMLAFEDASFDAIICVEAAFHFDTRRAFYNEVFRLLKPGGAFVTSDTLFTHGFHKHVPSNYLKSMDTLGDQLRETGFTQVRVIDSTQECWQGYTTSLRRWPLREFHARRMAFPKAIALTALARVVQPIVGLGIRNYVLTAAERPSA